MSPPFSKEIKRRSKADQDFKCAVTHKRCDLEGHHAVPESLNGSNGRVNIVSLCHGVHQVADKLAFQGVTYYGDIKDLPDYFFRYGGNPFKNFDYNKSEDVPKDLLRIAKRAKRRYLKKRKHKKIETMPCPRQGWYT